MRTESFVVTTAVLGALCGCSTAPKYAQIDKDAFESAQQTDFVFDFKIDLITASQDQFLDSFYLAAEEACGESDYDYHLAATRVKKKNWGKDAPAMVTDAAARVYCNNLFTDTREQQPDDVFLEITALEPKLFDAHWKGPLQDMLLASEFEELEAALAALADAYDGSPELESAFDDAVEKFEVADPDITEGIERWLAASPESPWPYYISAIHNLGLAWYHRGHTMPDGVPDEKWPLFNGHRAAARSNLDSCEELGLKLPSVWTHRIAAMKGGGEFTLSEYRAVHDKAIASFPTAAGPRRVYLMTITDRWYGSDEMTDAYMQELRNADVPAGTLNSVTALFYAERARTAFEKSDEATAEYLLAQSIGAMDNAWAYSTRSAIQANKKQFVKALESITVAQQLAPTDEYYLLRQSILAAAAAQPLLALTAISAASALRPEDPELLEQKAKLFFSFRRYREARNAYYKAAEVKNNDARLRHLARHANFQLEVRGLLDDQDDAVAATGKGI